MTAITGSLGNSKQSGNKCYDGPPSRGIIGPLGNKLYDGPPS